MSKKNKNIMAFLEESFLEKLEATSMRDLRSLAFHFLYAMEQFDYDISLEAVVDTFRRGFNLELSDDSLAIRIAKGVIENRKELDREIVPLLKNWELKRLGLCTRLILRMAVWELNQPDAIVSVVINEAIELSKDFAEKDAYKFVNGILDELAKSRGMIDEAGSDDEKSE
ncbi:transcription antitermination factor NusB [Candidatus Babeliales bacterium]|nr:transcription antitermination factor NusB [Candidatus Babeliales bacterium]